MGANVLQNILSFANAVCMMTIAYLHVFMIEFNLTNISDIQWEAVYTSFYTLSNCGDENRLLMTIKHREWHDFKHLK